MAGALNIGLGLPSGGGHGFPKGGGSCPVAAQPLPTRGGQLLAGGSCPTCCATPLPKGGGGVQHPCDDQGQGGGQTLSFITQIPGQSAFGTSPVALRYYVDLSTVPANAVFKWVRATYDVGGLPPRAVHDPGGDSGAGTTYVDWLPAGLAYLNANIGNASTPIDATATFGMMGNVRCVEFLAYYAPALAS